MQHIERVTAIGIKEGQAFRLEGTAEQWLVYMNGDCAGHLELKALDRQLLFLLLRDQAVPQRTALQLYGAGERVGTISEGLRRINQVLRDVLGYTQQGEHTQDALKTLKKNRHRPETEIANQLGMLKGIEYFVSATDSNRAVWKTVSEQLGSFPQPAILKEANRLHQLLREEPEPVLATSDSALKVLLICEPDALQTVMVQLMQTLANFSNIALEFNRQPDFEREDYLAFIVLITPGLNVFYQETIERVLRYADQHQRPLFAFKERSVEQLNMVAEWIEYSQDDFWFSVSDICEVFHRVYSTVLAKRLQGLAQSAPDEYVQKYADLYDVRLLTNIDAKKRIARAVVEEAIYRTGVKNIFLDSGTVTYYIAEQLCQDGAQIKIYTNNLSIVRLKSMCARIHLLPGDLDAQVEATVGLEPAQYLRELCQQGKIELGILGLRSFERDMGFGEDTPSLKGVQKALFEAVPQLVLVAQGEKLFKPVKNPLYKSVQEGMALIQERRARSALRLYVHEPTLEHLAQRLTPLKTYYHRYQHTLADLQEALGGDAVRLLRSSPSTPSLQRTEQALRA